jgi:1,4-dihydroxy-2-naphthoyl-CoA hydrolase
MNPLHDFRYHFHVRLHDTDAAGLLFFAHLLRHAHDAYESLLEHAGLPLAELIERGARLPLAHAEADYLAAMRHGARVSVRLHVARLGQRSFTLDYAFHLADGTLAARAQSVHVAVAATAGQTAALPPDLRAILQQLTV